MKDRIIWGASYLVAAGFAALALLFGIVLLPAASLVFIAAAALAAPRSRAWIISRTGRKPSAKLLVVLLVLAVPVGMTAGVMTTQFSPVFEERDASSEDGDAGSLTGVTPAPTPASPSASPTASASSSPAATSTASPTRTTSRITSPTSASLTPTPTATAVPQDRESATASPTPTSRSSESYRVTVTRVVDGDTLEIEYRNGTADTVRLLGVDTPEVHTVTDPAEWEGVPENQAERDCLRRYGERASEYMVAELAGETVTIETDTEADTRGYYGRLLVYVGTDGESYNLRLLERGLARYYDSAFSRAQTYRDTESAARGSGQGAWACQSVSTATPTPTATPASGGGEPRVGIAQIQADAPGDEYDNLNGEYIEIENRGSDTADLSGWTISEGDGVTYTFETGFTLGPGESVKVHTGSGSNSASDRYWGQEHPVWNNGGDTGTIRDASGAIVDQLEYS